MNMTFIRRRILICGVVAGTSAICVIGCGSQQKASRQQPPAAEVPTIAVAKAGVADLSHNLAVTAEFQAVSGSRPDGQGGRLRQKINVDIGDRVRQGQLLATLEIPEMTDEVNGARAERAAQPGAGDAGAG